MNIKDFQETVKLVKHAVAEEDNRPILQALHCESEGDKTYIVTADGSRLAYTIITDKIPDGNYNIVSDKTIRDILKSKDRYGILPSLPNMEGTYPNWRQLMPAEERTTFEIRISDLQVVAQALSDCKIMRCVIDEDSLTISGTTSITHNPLTLSTSIPLEEIVIIKNFVKFGINPNYLLDYCKAINTVHNSIPIIAVCLGHWNAPIIFKHYRLEEIIMPMSVEWEK